MSEATDAAVSHPERNIGIENLYLRVKHDKELSDLRSMLDSFQSLLSEGQFFTRQIANSGTDEDVHLGDYGNLPTFSKDYLLNKIFKTLAVKDANGSTISVNSLRNLANQSLENSPKLKLKGEDGETVDVDFFAGKKEVNFNCWLCDLSEEKKGTIVSNLESIPPKIWAKSIVQQLSEQQGQILENEEICALEAFNWKTPDLVSDFTYFVNEYGFSPRFGWSREEVETLLNGQLLSEGRVTINTWKDPNTNENWSVLSSIKGVGLAFKKGESGVSARILIDTAELRGRKSESSFLDSKTAKDILGVFDKLGLEPTDEMLNDFTEGSLGYGHYSSRYGNGYADLSRLVTYVAREGFGIERLVSVKDPNFTSDNLHTEAKRLSAPAKLIIKMMAGIMEKGNQVIDQPFQIGSFSGRSIRDGSCKDSESYFSGSLGIMRCFRDGIFICKSGYGADTKINTVPIVADGIEFPPGYLFRVEGQSKIEPLRATMYCFSNDEARDAFGWQYLDALNNDFSLQRAIDSFPSGWNIPDRSKTI